MTWYAGEDLNFVLLHWTFSVGSTQVSMLKDLQFTTFNWANWEFSMQQVNIKLSFDPQNLFYIMIINPFFFLCDRNRLPELMIAGLKLVGLCLWLVSLGIKVLPNAVVYITHWTLWWGMLSLIKCKMKLHMKHMWQLAPVSLCFESHGIHKSVWADNYWRVTFRTDTYQWVLRLLFCCSVFVTVVWSCWFESR